jgi:hypothetical protein
LTLRAERGDTPLMAIRHIHRTGWWRTQDMGEQALAV